MTDLIDRRARAIRRGAQQGAPPAVLVTQALKTYRPVTALDRVDLTVAEGTFTVLLGPSGSGKSTLIRTLAGIERLDAGTVRIGEDTVDDGRRHVAPERRNLAMVFQDYALWPHLSVRANVAYALRRRRLGKSEASRRSLDALDRVGLAHLAARYPHQLSGGEQQRVGLARALVARPALLLFDEPLSNLDADLRERLRIEIATLTRESGATAVYITHDQSEAFALADSISILNCGRIEQSGTPEQIYQRPATPFVASFTGVAGLLRGQVVERNDQMVMVRTGSHVVLARPVGAMPIGSTVDVAVRAAGVSVTEPAQDGMSPAISSVAGDIPATVRDIAYRGRGYDLTVDYGHGLLTSIFTTDALARGSTCQLRLDANVCSAFLADTTDRASRDITTVSNSSEPSYANPLPQFQETGA